VWGREEVVAHRERVCVAAAAVSPAPALRREDHSVFHNMDL